MSDDDDNPHAVWWVIMVLGIVISTMGLIDSCAERNRAEVAKPCTEARP